MGMFTLRFGMLILMPLSPGRLIVVYARRIFKISKLIEIPLEADSDALQQFQ